MPNFKVSVRTAGAIHRSNLLFITWHKLLELRLIIGKGSFTGLKGRRLSMLLHRIPIHTVCRLHNCVGSVRLIIVGTVIPHGIAICGAGLQDTFSNRPEHGAIRRIRECRCHLGSLAGTSGKGRRIIKCPRTGSAGHLIPLASIRSCNNSMRCIWLFKLGCTPHLHGCSLSVRPNCRRTDLAAGDLRIL